MNIISTAAFVFDLLNIQLPACALRYLAWNFNEFAFLRSILRFVYRILVSYATSSTMWVLAIIAKILVVVVAVVMSVVLLHYRHFVREVIWITIVPQGYVRKLLRWTDPIVFCTRYISYRRLHLRLFSNHLHASLPLPFQCPRCEPYWISSCSPVRVANVHR